MVYKSSVDHAFTSQSCSWEQKQQMLAGAGPGGATQSIYL